MVRGMSKFREYFKDFNEQYIFIGGAACDLLMNSAGLDFRATKDLDMVLILEALTKEFGLRFWDFIKDAGYELKEKSSGELQFYRFSKPKVVLCQDNGHIKPLFFSKISKMHKLVAFIPRFA